MKKIFKKVVTSTLCVVMMLSLICSNTNNIVYASDDLTESDIYLLLPQYLQCDVMEKYFSDCYDYCMDALDTVSTTDEYVGAFLYGLKSGAKFLIKEGASYLGLTSSNFESKNKEFAGELLKNYFAIEENCLDDAKEIYEDYKYITKTYKGFSNSIIEDFKAANKKRKYIVYTDEYIEEIFSDTRITGKIIDKFGAAQEGLEVFMGILETNQLELETIDKLIASSRSVDSALAQGLIEIRDDITSDLPGYLLKNYFNDKALDKISSIFTKATAGHISGGATVIVTFLADVGYSIYSNFKPSVNDIMAANLFRSYTDSAGSVVDCMTLKFCEGKATEEDIDTYRIVYNFYITSLKIWMSKCKKLLKNSHEKLKSKLTVYGDALGDEVNYDMYFKICKSRATKAVQEGIVKIENNDVTLYTDEGKKIDSSYDSTESIKSRLLEIQKVYKPNVGQKWTLGYMGSKECNGFARMVFNKLFGYNVTGYIGSDRSVLQNETNVIKVGQLKGNNVTKDKLKTIFANAKIGDFLQVCGGKYGQHSSIITSVDDGGVNVYDCNWSTTEYCVIKTHKFTWDNLVSLYSSPYTTKDGKVIPNGVSIYRANNYTSIYGNGEDLFYDDSVNFVIQDGVLIKYNGWQPYVIIPDDVVEIGARAFEDNDNIIGIEIPDGVVKIGAFAFSGCSQLLCVCIPDSVEEIGEYAFSQCTRLASIHLPDNKKYTEISESMMRNDVSLQKIDFPENITRIGNFAFYNCDRLEEVILPKYLVTLGGGTFLDADSIRYTWIPKSLKNVYYDTDFLINYKNNGAFDSCDNLVEIEFEKGITAIPDNMMFGCNGIKEITIPDTVTKIGDSAFYNCISLEKINLSNSLISIGEFAFYNCDSISEVILPSGLTSLGGGCFYGCDGIKKVFIPKSIKNTYLGTDFFINYRNNGVFDQCSGLKTIEFQEGISELTENMFFGCTGLENITIPATVKNINDQAFMGCVNLKKIVVPDNVDLFGEGVFQECKSLTEAILPDHFDSVPQKTFMNCNSLLSFKLPENAVTIYPDAFYNCESLKEIIFNKKLKLIGSSSFYGCKALVDIVFPQNVKAINSYAFANCESIEKVSLNDNLITIDHSAFEYDKNLKTLSLPDSLNYIGAYAFQHCDSLNSVSFGSGISNIPEYCFYECPQLENILLPQQVKNISSYAFGNCTGLTDITINKKVTEITVNAFSYLDRLTIHGIPGTYAEQFAKENNIKFVTLNNNTESIKLKSNTLSIGVGEEQRITATIVPVDSKDELTWSSSAEDIVTVDEDGNIEALAPGTATIIAMSGSVIETCEVTVYKAVDSVYLDRDTLEGTIGDEIQLTAYIYPDDATNKNVTWSSNNKSVADVDENGKVTLKSYGEAEITVTTEDKEMSYSCKVTVKSISVTSVDISLKNATVYIDNTLELTATVYPENATNKAVTWSSSKNSVATVDNGVVTGISEGTAVIIVKTVDGSKTATCTVTVSKADHEWDDGVVTKEPTCTENGIRTYSCKTCDETKTEEIPATGHSTVIDEAVAATCTEDGLTEGSHCSVCNTVIVPQQVIPAEHHFGEWQQDEEDINKLYRVCDACGEKEYSDHRWDEGTVTLEASCTSDGIMTYICEDCGETKTETIKATGHTIMVDSAVQATCTTDGWTEGCHCSVCNEIIKAQEKITSLGHDWDSGKVTKEATAKETGIRTYTCNRCGETKEEEIPMIQNVFNDVQNSNKYYYEPIYWAYENGITTGTSETTFSPEESCTRAQFVTFLWRYYGCPEPTTTKNFSDVKSGKFYYKAVMWAAETGITTGYKGTDKFGVNDYCTREQCVTFIYRAAKEPDVTEEDTKKYGFNDSKKGYYADAVTWAAMNDITKGVNKTTFGVGSLCTRGQLVTFLYRYASLDY